MYIYLLLFIYLKQENGTVGPIQLSTNRECKILSEIFLCFENSGWPNPLVYTYNYVAGNMAYIRQGTNNV